MILIHEGCLDVAAVEEGRAMLSALEEAVKARGIHVLQLISIAENHGFYRASGFEKDGAEVLFRRY